MGASQGAQNAEEGTGMEDRSSPHELAGSLIDRGRRVVGDLVDRVGWRRKPEKTTSSDTRTPASVVSPERYTINQRHPECQTSLTDAIRAGDLTSVEEILKHPGIDVNYPGNRQDPGFYYRQVTEPPIIVATKAKNPEVLWVILEAGANVSATDSSGCNAIYLAAEVGDEASLAVLLRHSTFESVNNPGKCYFPFEYNPIHKACENGHFGVVKMLVGAGCSLDPAKEERMLSPLDLAITKGHDLIGLYLLEHGAKLYPYKPVYRPSFLMACQYCCYHVVKHYIESGVDVDMRSVQSPTNGFYYAIQYGDMRRIVREIEMIKNGGGTHKETKEEISERLRKSVSVVELLCEARGKINKPTTFVERPPLYHALDLYNLPACLVLLRHGAIWDESCDDVFQKNHISMLYIFDRSLYLTLLQMLDNSRQLQFWASNSCIMVPSLKQCCRRTIRSCIHRYGTPVVSILPRLQLLPLPEQLRHFLCYDELHSDYFLEHLCGF